MLALESKGKNAPCRLLNQELIEDGLQLASLDYCHPALILPHLAQSLLLRDEGTVSAQALPDLPQTLQRAQELTQDASCLL
jgi:hypothetical protein